MRSMRNRRVITINRFLDKYPSILSLSFDTKGLIEGTAETANRIVKNIEHSLINDSKLDLLEVFKPTLELPVTAQSLCLEMVPDMVRSSLGQEVVDYTMEIMPGEDNESLLVQTTSLVKHMYKLETYEAVEELSKVLVGGYLSEVEKISINYECDDKGTQESGSGILQ